MGKKTRRTAIIEDAPIQNVIQEAKILNDKIEIQYQTINALKKLFAEDGPYAAIQINTQGIKTIFQKYDELKLARDKTIRELCLLIDWIKDKPLSHPVELIVEISNKYNCLSQESICRYLLPKEKKTLAKLEAWVIEINTNTDAITTQLAKKQPVQSDTAPLFTTIDNKAKPSEQFMDMIEVEINNSDAVMRFSEKLCRFGEHIKKLPDDFPQKQDLIGIRNQIEKDVNELLATETDICSIMHRLNSHERLMKKREEVITDACKSQNIRFLAFVQGLKSRLDNLHKFNPSIEVNRIHQTLEHLKKPRYKEEIVWLEWATLEQIRKDINQEIEKNRLEQLRQKNIIEDCEEINEIIRAIAAERDRIQKKNPTFLNKDPRIPILNKLQIELTKNIKEYSNPREKKQFILNVIDTFHHCVTEQILHDLTDKIASPFCVFVRQLLEPVYQLLKYCCGLTYMPHFFSSESEKKVALIAQNAEYRFFEILARLNQQQCETRINTGIFSQT